MSRVVSGLAARRLVLRAIDDKDARGVRLTLTRAGRKLYEGLISAAVERNDAFLDCLSEKERAAFDAVLDKLAARAREFIERERSVP
jgi:DNA-binding MarR family transcriptional regulator